MNRITDICNLGAPSGITDVRNAHKIATITLKNKGLVG
jgi:hypothetical protein